MNFTVIKSWVMLFTYGLSIVLCLLSGSGVKPVVHISSNACNVQIGSGNVMIVNDVRRKRSTKSQPIPEPMITGITILNVQSRSHLNDTRLHNRNEMITSHK